MASLYDVTVECGSNKAHVQQLYTGFSRLSRCGIAAVRWNYGNPELRDRSAVRATLNNEVRMVYDCRDSGDLFQDLYTDCDFYFKRSLRPGDQKEYPKTHPLGLNYLVYRDTFDWILAARSILLKQPFRKRLSGLGTALMLERVLGTRRFGIARVGTTSETPAPVRRDRDVQVAFFVGLWDPAAETTGPRREERHSINRMRMECVRALRAELGPQFVGGVIPDGFAVQECPKQLLADASRTLRTVYLEDLRRVDISVATTGLHGSVGFKLAEYVAFSKCIVTEPLGAELPGTFAEGRNYLAFDDPDSCVRQALRLVHDPSLRSSMSWHNHRYYLNHVMPERLVLNTLLVAGRTR